MATLRTLLDLAGIITGVKIGSIQQHDLPLSLPLLRDQSLPTVLLSYSLYHLFANTYAGARFAEKTRSAIALEHWCCNCPKPRKSD